MIETVKSIVGKVKQYDEAVIGRDTNLVEELNFDSMEVMNLILELEKTFAVTFRDEHLDLEHFLTVGSIMKTLEGYDVGSR